jgi:hypothetical protein
VRPGRRKLAARSHTLGSFHASWLRNSEEGIFPPCHRPPYIAVGFRAFAKVSTFSGLTMPNDLPALRTRLQASLAEGLAEDPLAHAEQVAEIAGVLHEAFEPEGFSATLVGGSAIEIHAPGVYLSGDLDYVIERTRPGTKKVDAVFESLGFKKQGGRHWVLGDLFIEQVSGPVAGPAEEVRVGQSVFRVVTKEVALRDRVVGFKQWQYTAYGEQAVDMLAAFGDEVDESWLRPELRQEDSLDALEALRDLAKSDQPVTEEILRTLLDRLHRRSPGYGCSDDT